LRINKFFSDQGFCSRRQADRLIAAGRVRINGRLAGLGDQVSQGDQVTVDGNPVASNSPKVYVMYNKPKGIICTTDRAIHGNIADAVAHPLRVFHIGRLDKDSTGLIFMTNDGDIVNRILRAQYGHEKEYEVEVDKPLTEEFLKRMSGGVDIGDYVTKPCAVKQVSKNTFTIILTEGKNRQIRRMCESLGFFVRKLHRFRIMNVEIGDLKPGEWKDIPEPQMKALQAMLSESSQPAVDVDVEE
jgi:23S rRNA pseudouridine2604 synthase